MTLNFQNKIVFPAPESSYTTETAYGQVIYIPRNILSKPKKQYNNTGKDQMNNQRRAVAGSNIVPFIPNDRQQLPNQQVDQSDDQSTQAQSLEKSSELNQENILDVDEEKKQIILNENKKQNKLLDLQQTQPQEQDNQFQQQQPDNRINKTSSTFSTFSSFSSQEQQRLVECIPCLYLPYDDGASKLVIYFHGNAEDIGLAFDLLYQFGNELKMHVLAVEYPGYGLYKTSQPNENQIKEDSEIIFDYLTKHVGIKESDIILFGRSMGSGPATYLASKKFAYSLLLMSPYTSIKDVSKSLLGKLSFLLTPIVYERFRNIDTIKEAKCPVFFLHGLVDKLIPHSHSLELNNNCPTVSYLQLPQNMDHNEFDFIEDLIKPFQEFITRIDDGQRSIDAKQNTNEEQKHQEQSNEGNTDFQIVKKERNSDSEEDFFTHYSDIDNSLVDYLKSKNTFEVFFDKSLYEPPQVIIENEKKLATQALQKSQKK